MFDFSNVYALVWPTDPDTNEPIFSLIIQANQDMEGTIVDNVYGNQPYFSTAIQDPDHNRP